MREALLGLLAEEQAEEGGVAMAEEEDKVEDQRRRSSAASMVVPLQAPELVEGGPMSPRLFSGQGTWEEGWGLLASKKAQGKVPAVEPLPLEMDEGLAWWLQEEENEAEWMRQGQDSATLAVVREATGPLMWGQVEGFVGPS